MDRELPCQEESGDVGGQEAGHGLAMSAHSPGITYPALHQNNSVGSRSREVTLSLYSALMRGRTGPTHKSMCLQAVDRTIVQDSVKCSAQVQEDDVCCSSPMHHSCDPTAEGQQICQALFAFIEAMLAVTNHCRIFPVQSSWEEALGRHCSTFEYLKGNLQES